MGILREQSIRLRREASWNADDLAEEIYSIFNSDRGLVVDGPITINNNTSQAPITINQAGNTDQSIRITRYPDPPLNLPGIPPLPQPADLGNINITIVYTDGTGETWNGPPGNPDNNGPRNPRRGTGDPINQGGGGGFPGKVLSGTGSTYLVAVYEDGLSGSPTVRTVTQLQIDSGETIPANTWTLVAQSGDSYYMQVPVWL